MPRSIRDVSHDFQDAVFRSFVGVHLAQAAVLRTNALKRSFDIGAGVHLNAVRGVEVFRE